MSQLREAQREIALRTEYAGERLSDDAAAVFSWDGLLSIVAPPGSLVDKIIGGVGTGIAAVQGISSVLGMWRERRGSCDDRKHPKSRRRTKDHPRSKKDCGC